VGITGIGKAPVLDRLKRWAEARRIRSRPRIGSMATMPTRAGSFARVLPAVAPQVDRLYLYLDGFTRAPDPIRAFSNVVPLFAHEHGDLHATGRFLPLALMRKPCVFIVFDDDILYPATYVREIVDGLAAFAGRAVVGYHGDIFLAPYGSYVKDRHCYHFAKALAEHRPVHCIGAGTAAFDSARLRFDPRAWPRIRGNDLMLAIEAERRGLARIALARGAGWLKPLGEIQPDSVYGALLADDRQQTAMMNTLLELSSSKGGTAASAVPAP
jgi:hypothetical protein